MGLVMLESLCGYSINTVIQKERYHTSFMSTVEVSRSCITIREIPDHATFRVKGANLAWLDKLGGSLSLALCNLANFEHLWFPKYSVLYTISIC